MKTTFKTALSLLDLKPSYDELIGLHSKDKRETFILKELSNKIDLSKLFVQKINYSCDPYNGTFNCWEFWICDENGHSINLIDLYWIIHKREK